jgi:hypothetical protein
VLTYHCRLCPANVVNFPFLNQSQRNTRKQNRSRIHSESSSPCPSYVLFATLGPGLVSRRLPLTCSSSFSATLPLNPAALHSLYVHALLYRISAKVFVTGRTNWHLPRYGRPHLLCHPAVSHTHPFCALRPYTLVQRVSVPLALLLSLAATSQHRGSNRSSHNGSSNDGGRVQSDRCG